MFDLCSLTQVHLNLKALPKFDRKHIMEPEPNGLMNGYDQVIEIKGRRLKGLMGRDAL